MIAALLSLPAALLATQITISEVTAEREGGRVSITVNGDAMIDPEAASAKLTDGHLYLFVRDARVREANRSWKNGAVEGGEEIRAHRHKQKVELAVPLGDDGCQGPVEFETMPGGLRAFVGCDGAPRPGVARAARAARAAAAKADAQDEETDDDDAKAAARSRRERRSPALTPVPALALGESESEARGEAKAATPAAPRLSVHDAAALKTKLALDTAGALEVPEPARPAPIGKAASPKTAAPAAAVVPAAPPRAPAAPALTPTAPAEAKLATPVAPPLDAPGLAPRASAAAVAPHDKLAPASGGGGGTGAGVVLAGCVLLAIAGAAFFFSRRRSIGSRHIQILETASLGPKRALIVAHVGDATLILGSSEAGITLLQSLPDSAVKSDRDGAPVEAAIDLGAAAAAVEAAATSSVPAAPAGPSMKIHVEDRAGAPFFTPELPSPDELRPVGQAGLLSRLFKRGTPANDASAPRFEDLLEDSFEDQELRRKLALGLPGRVR
jgi:hypothetical protein